MRVPGLPARRAATPAGHVDILPTLVNLAGGTPLDNAVGYACWQVARLLVARGARRAPHDAGRVRGGRERRDAEEVRRGARVGAGG